MRGTDGDDCFLFLQSPTDNHEGKSVGSTPDERSQPPNPSDSTPPWSSNETWQLKDFRGSGEYVDVEATIDAVLYVRKNTKGVPDIKGELIDASVLKPVYFIVADDTTHPRLEEGKQFLFRNVKDHSYKNKAEVQVVFSGTTEVIEK